MAEANVSHKDVFSLGHTGRTLTGNNVSATMVISLPRAQHISNISILARVNMAISYLMLTVKVLKVGCQKR